MNGFYNEGGNAMEINLNNYEVYVIDYLDNKLNALQIAELLLFLENNPELKEDLEAIRSFNVTPNRSEVFGFNELLIQPSDKDAELLSNENYSHYFIAYLEGDLNDIGIAKLDQFLEEHPELKGEFQIFASCRLKPEKNIRYPELSELKVKPKRAYIRYYLATGIAASILLMGTIYLRLNPETGDSVNKAINQSVEQQFQGEENSNVIPDTKVLNSDEKETGRKTVIEERKAAEKNKSIKETSRVKPEHKPLRKIERKPMILNTTPLMAENSSRNFYSNLYDDIRLSQELALASAEEKDEIIESKKNEKVKGVMAGRIINSVISSGEQIAEQLPASMNGWLMADLGIKGFNFLTNNNYSINRSYNSKGNIKALKVEEEKKL